ncbi:hypothetical protein DN409_27825 (plasmid) [Bacillus mycoides]|nr:hypothetical protein DN409_27825 [Bacillus mycoides]
MRVEIQKFTAFKNHSINTMIPYQYIKSVSLYIDKRISSGRLIEHIDCKVKLHPVYLIVFNKVISELLCNMQLRNSRSTIRCIIEDLVLHIKKFFSRSINMTLPFR